MAIREKNKWMNRVFKRILKDLEKILDRHQKGKKVDLSRWDTIENVIWIIEFMKQYLEE